MIWTTMGLMEMSSRNRFSQYNKRIQWQKQLQIMIETKDGFGLGRLLGNSSQIHVVCKVNLGQIEELSKMS